MSEENSSSVLGQSENEAEKIPFHFFENQTKSFHHKKYNCLILPLVPDLELIVVGTEKFFPRI